MLFNELELGKMVKKGLKNLTIEDEIKFNILNFIHCIYMNQQNFYRDRFDSKFFGDLEMTFKKEANCLIGYCKVVIKKENKTISYLFTENGYELLNEVVNDKINS